MKFRTRATPRQDSCSQERGMESLCNVPTRQEEQSRSRQHQHCYAAEGGGVGVVTKKTSTQWFNGAKKDGLEKAEVGDGVKIYPNPARYNSGGTVQKQKSNALNTYKGYGSGTVDGDLRIRYLTPRECLRLMGYHDDEIDRLMKAVPSKTNLYKLAGNSIVVDCLEGIFRSIYIDRTFDCDRTKQKSLTEFDFKAINPVVGRSPEELERTSETGELP